MPSNLTEIVSDEESFSPETRTILLVDDSRMQRRILRAMLNKWGFHVLEADSGHEALNICQAKQVDIIISDWMMPGMNGLEFCAEFRSLQRDSYGYFILLTSKSETDEVVHGLDVGADDFLTKPVNGSELRARLSAGERILGMASELNEKNRIIGDALAKLQDLYDGIDRDLAQARTIQDSLVPERYVEIEGGQVSMLLKPCGHVGGDLIGMFQPGRNRLGFYSIDVSGHGVTSALMTARLASYMNGRFLEHNIALERRFEHFFSLRPPDEVAQLLNDRLLSDVGVEEYFTMAYGVMDVGRGKLKMVQAGHPHPVVQRADGSIEYVGTGGPPIGLLPDMVFESFDISLNPGDRVLLYSDGFTEAVCADGEMLGEEGLTELLAKCADMRGPEVLDDMFWRLTSGASSDGLDDDVSAILLEYDGSK